MLTAHYCPKFWLSPQASTILHLLEPYPREAAFAGWFPGAHQRQPEAQDRQVRGDLQGGAKGSWGAQRREHTAVRKPGFWGRKARGQQRQTEREDGSAFSEPDGHKTQTP